MTANQEKCIVLIGFRGCGKTTVGRELARLLGGGFADTDELVAERAGRSIAEIFTSEGEVGFRRRESEAIREVLRAPPTVISVGGGAVLDEGNVRALRTVAVVVWLAAPADVLWERISLDASTSAFRPPLTNQTGIGEVGRLLAERTPFYQRAADLQIEAVNREPRKIAEEIVTRVGPLSSARG